MTEWTKESLDALIDGLEAKITAPGEYSPEWISGFRIGEQALAGAILESQPERVEPTRAKWAVRSIDGRVVCLYCGRGCADASYPQGTCDECGDTKDEAKE